MTYKSPGVAPGASADPTEHTPAAALGQIFVAPEVLVTIVRQVVSSEPGVARLSGRVGGRRKAGRGQIATSDGVRIAVDEQNGVTVDLRIIVTAGVNMVEMAHALQNLVTRAIEHMVEMKVHGVNVHIDDVELSSSDEAAGPPNPSPAKAKGQHK